MQIVSGSGVAPAAPVPASQAVVVVGAGSAAAPMEPARRVTANRDGGRGDLVPQHAPRSAPGGQRRGRLIDLLV